MCFDGPNIVLIKEQNDLLKKWVIEMGQMGYAVTKWQLGKSVM